MTPFIDAFKHLSLWFKTLRMKPYAGDVEIVFRFKDAAKTHVAARDFARLMRDMSTTGNDAPLSEAGAPAGNMYGIKFRFETIVDFRQVERIVHISESDRR